MTEISYHGERFRLAEKMGLMPLMKFAVIARRGADSADMEGLAAMYDLLQQCIADEDWSRFEETATRARDQGEELMEVLSQAIEVMAARPSQRPSDSSDGPPITSGNSTAASSSPAVRRLEQKGRPELALIVMQAQEAREAAEAS